MANSPAQAIVDALGGADNITNLTHCATRLRFELRDASGVSKDAVEKIPGVMGAVPQGTDRYQVIIGGAVQTVFNDIQALPAMANAGAGGDPNDPDAIKAAERAKGPRGKNAWLDSFFEFLSNSFRPILGALLGASLFITFMSLMSTLEVIPNWADPTVTLPTSWQFVNMMWQCVFTFLPLMVAYNASKQVGADPWVGFSIMALLMLPAFYPGLMSAPEAHAVNAFGSDVTVVPIFGIPLTIFNYAQQVFPPLLMAAVLGPLWKLLTKTIPSNVQLIFVPFLAMLIMIPLTAFVIGPIGVFAGAWLADGLSAINEFSPFIFAIIIPLAYPFMVPLGLHWPINAVILLNIQTLGYDFIQGPMGAWNFSCFGATAGVLLISMRARDNDMRQTSTGALAAGLLGGISEPSLYGIHLRFKRIYPRLLVGCFVGGLIIGIGGGVTTNAFVFTSLLTIPAFDPLGLYGLAVLAAFFTSFTLVVLSDYRTPEQRAQWEETLAARDREDGAGAAPAAAAAASATAAQPAPQGGGTATLIAVKELVSPLDGTVIPLDQVPDPVFAGGLLGPGVGILPSSHVVCSPGPGKVVTAAETGHAVGLEIDGGIEVLIHVGIDTVNLGGKGFEVKVRPGDRVEVGTPLVSFDPAVIEAAGYSMATPVIVLNAAQFSVVDPMGLGPIQVGQPLIAIERE